MLIQACASVGSRARTEWMIDKAGEVDPNISQLEGGGEVLMKVKKPEEWLPLDNPREQVESA